MGNLEILVEAKEALEKARAWFPQEGDEGMSSKLDAIIIKLNEALKCQTSI